jgi:hypothetical protein
MFAPDDEKADGLLAGLPSLLPEQKMALEVPFTLGELTAAVEAMAPNRAPGLDGLPYEFYKRMLPAIGPSLLLVFNGMLEASELGRSLRTGVVQLIPKVQGVPQASQLRPITLLTCDYKLLTKMFVNRLLLVLPTVLQASQLCSVRSRSIFVAIL